MARPGVSYEDVAEAANYLNGQGRRPTVEQVRLVLGTGSSTTIANHLRIWKEAQSGTSVGAIKENIPDELVSLIKGLWERLISQSEEKIMLVEQNYQSSLEEVQADLDKYRKNNNRWQNLYKQWNEAKIEYEKTIHSLTTELEDLDCDHTTLKGQHDLLVQQLAEKELRIKELHELNHQIQKNIEHERRSNETAMLHERNSFEKQLQQAQNEIKSAGEKYDKLDEAHIGALQHLESITKEKDRLAIEAEMARKEISTLSQDKIDLVAMIKDQGETMSTLQQKVAHSNSENNMLNKQVDGLKGQIAELIAENKSLIEHKSQLQNKVRQLSQSTKKRKETIDE